MDYNRVIDISDLHTYLEGAPVGEMYSLRAPEGIKPFLYEVRQYTDDLTGEVSNYGHRTETPSPLYIHPSDNNGGRRRKSVRKNRRKSKHRSKSPRKTRRSKRKARKMRK
jgi:hypothetical protein